jgi:hypothetical protein
VEWLTWFQGDGTAEQGFEADEALRDWSFAAYLQGNLK